jgi:transposase-like protein
MAKIDKETLYNLYWEKGYSQGEIADQLQRSESTVSRWMRIYRIPTRKDRQMRTEVGAKKSPDVQAIEKRFGASIEDVLFGLYWVDGHLSQSAVAEQLGMDSSTVSRWMTMYRIPTKESMTRDDIQRIAAKLTTTPSG